MRFPVIAVTVFLLVGCSAGSQRWYNPGQTQVDFDQDSQECEIIAEEFGRQATLTGNRAEPEAYARTYNNCLYAKGWSVQPPQAAADSPAAPYPPLAALLENGTVQGFGKTFTMPSGFVLLSDVTQAYGPTLMQNIFFLGPEESYLNFTFQKGLTRDFEVSAYPVREPFFLYEQGVLADNPDLLRWTIFSGNVQDSWVAGLGGYFLLNDRQRVSIVMTRPLPASAEELLPGLKLDAGQIKAVEEFRAAWLPWLESQAAGGARSEKR